MLIWESATGRWKPMNILSTERMEEEVKDSHGGYIGDGKKEKGTAERGEMAFLTLPSLFFPSLPLLSSLY